MFCSIKLVFIRQKWSYFRIDISSGILQCRRKIFFFNQNWFNRLLQMKNVGHSNSVPLIVTSHSICYSISFLHFYWPLSLLILFNRNATVNFALPTLHIFIGSSSFSISPAHTFAVQSLEERRNITKHTWPLGKNWKYSYKMLERPGCSVN